MPTTTPPNDPVTPDSKIGPVLAWKAKVAQPSDDRSAIADGLKEALAIRHMHLARQLAQEAVGYGNELPEACTTLPSCGEMAARYQELVGEWVVERPYRVRDALALVQFAGAVIADKPIFDCLNEGGPVSDELDRHHAVLALTAVADWLTKREYYEHFHITPGDAA